MSIVKLKKSSVPGKIPLTGDLDFGEIAVNYADGTIYYKNTLTQIQSIGSIQSTTLRVTTSTVSNATNTGALIVTGGVGIGGALNVGGTITTTGTTGGITGAQYIYIAGNTATTSTNTGALTVAGGVGIGGSLFVGGAVTATTFVGALTGTASTATSAATAYALANTGTTYVARAVLADSATTATSAATAYALANTGTTYVARAKLADSATTATSAATAYSWVGGSVANATSFANTVTVTSVAVSASTSTGALIVTGGVGIGGALFAGGNISAGANLVSLNSSGDEGGEILLAKPQTNSTLVGTGVTIDIWQNRLRFFEQGGTARGFYVDITAGGAGVGTNLAAGGATGVTSLTGSSGTSVSASTGDITVWFNTSTLVTTAVSALSATTATSAATAYALANTGTTYVARAVLADSATTATSAATAYSTVAVHTAGTGLTGSTFNGSTAQTWTLNTSTLMALSVSAQSATTATSAATAYALANTGTTQVGYAVNATTSTSAATAYALANTGTTYVARAVLADSATTATSAATAYSWLGGTVPNPVTFSSPVTFAGTATYVLSTNTVYTDNLIELHTPPGGIGSNWDSSDGKDIGIRMHYYANGTDTNAALVLEPATGALEWFSSGTEVGNVFNGTYGSFKVGNILSNGVVTATTFVGNLTGTASTATSAATAYALANTGTTYIGRAVLADSATTATDSLNVTGGSIVATTGRFSGITTVTNTTVSTSTTTGALQVVGGVGVGGDLFVGGTTSSFGTTSSSVVNMAFRSTNNATLNIITDISGTGNGTINLFRSSNGTFNIGGSNNTFNFGTTGGFGSVVNIGSTGAQSQLYIRGMNGSPTIVGYGSSGPTNGIVEIFDSNALTVRAFGSGTDITIGWTTGTTTVRNTVILSNTTTSASTTTGALQVAGGVGVGGGVYVGGSVTATNLVVNGTSSSLNFTGTGNRITGDFSTTTFPNRVMFQTTVPNSNTAVSAIPSGAATQSFFHTYNNSDPTNSAFAQISASASAVLIASLTRGTGTLLPMSFTMAGTERLRIDTTGTVYIGTNTQYSGEKLAVNGSVYVNGVVTATNMFIGPWAVSTSSGGGGSFNGGTITNPLIVNNATASTSTNTGAIQVAGGVGIAGDLYVGGNIITSLPLEFNDVSNQTNGLKSVFALKIDQNSISNIVDSKNLEVIVDGKRLAYYINEQRYPWITPYDSYKGFRVVSRGTTAQSVVIYNTPEIGSEVIITQVNTSANKQTRKYPYSAATIALGD